MTSEIPIIHSLSLNKHVILVLQCFSRVPLCYHYYVFRQRAKLLPPLPKTRQEVVIEGKWAETTAGEKFLLADDGEENRIIIFGTVENLMELSHADIWYVDGTFYSSPTYFHQVYSIHAMIDGYMCTLVYALLPNKREDTYRRFFELVQGAGDTHNIEVKPAIIMMDYEMAAKRGVRIVFPDVVVKGCYFTTHSACGEKFKRVDLRLSFAIMMPSAR